MSRPAHRRTPPSPDAQLGDLLPAATRALRHHWAAQLQPHGIAPHHARALRLIVRDGAVRPGKVAEELRIAPRSATDVIDALEQRGLVERVSDPDDRRATSVRATPDGRALVGRIEEARSAGAEEFFAPLSPADQAELARLLLHLLDAGRTT